MYAVFVHKQAFGNVFPDVYRKVHFPIYSVLPVQGHFPALWKYFALFFRLWGKKKSKGDQIRQIITSLSYFSLSVPPPPPLRFPLLTAISSLFCTLCPIALSVSLQCWLGGQEDDGCIWGLRGRRCRICLTCSSKDSVSSSLSSNRAPGSLRQGGRWRIACVYVRAHACTCVCAWQLQRNIGEWWQVWY